MFWKRSGPTVDEFRDLESEVKRLRAEWEDMFERLTRKEDRLRKRQERETATEGALIGQSGVKAALRARWAAQRGVTNGS